MRLTNDALRAIRTAFSLKYTDAMNAAAATAIHGEFCTDVGDADFQIVEIPFLEQFAFMREWLGDRQIKNLQEKVLRLIEKPFEETVGISLRDLETGAWKQKGEIIAAMGQAGIQLWDDLFHLAILEPPAWIDDLPFFAATRKYGDGKKAGLINNTTADELDFASFGTAYTTMCSYVGSAGRPLRVKPTHILVGPALLDKAKEILESEKIRDANQVEVNNPHRGKVKISESLDLVGKYAKRWFMSANGNVIKPVAMQKSKTAELQTFDSMTDEMVFMSGKAVFGSAAYGNARACFPHLIYRGGPLVS